MKRHSLVQFVFNFISACFFKKTKFAILKLFIFNFKHQTNDGIFSNKAEENFSLAKIFWNVRVQLWLTNQAVILLQKYQDFLKLTVFHLLMLCQFMQLSQLHLLVICAWGYLHPHYFAFYAALGIACHCCICQ